MALRNCPTLTIGSFVVLCLVCRCQAQEIASDALFGYTVQTHDSIVVARVIYSRALNSAEMDSVAKSLREKDLVKLLAEPSASNGQLYLSLEERGLARLRDDELHFVRMDSADTDSIYVLQGYRDSEL